MSALDLIKLKLHLGGAPSKPFQVVPIIVEDDKVTLSDIIREQMKRTKPQYGYEDSDIKSAKSCENFDVLGILGRPVSVFLKFTEAVEVRELSVCIDPPSVKKARSVDVFERMRKANQTVKKQFKSEFELRNVIKFQEDYAATPNKEVFLSDFGNSKPPILAQIEAVVVDFLTTHNLGFESKEEEKATKALSATVRLFNFVHAHRSKFSHSSGSKFETPILKGIKLAVPAKAKPTRKNLSKDLLEKELDKSRSQNGIWPSSYYRPQYKDGPPVGKAIFTEIHNAVSAIDAHLRCLNDQDALNKAALNRRQGTTPTSSNSKFALIHGRYVNMCCCS